MLPDDNTPPFRSIPYLSYKESRKNFFANGKFRRVAGAISAMELPLLRKHGRSRVSPGRLSPLSYEVFLCPIRPFIDN
jgi:hypothetical protein